jgi:phage tail tape-measure protein
MANTSIEIEIKALDKTGRVFDKMEKSLGPLNRKVGKMSGQFDKVDKSVNKTGRSFTKLKGLIAGAVTVAGVASFGKAVLGAAGNAEDLKVALETVTGSAAEADKSFAFIRDFTEDTPFKVDAVAESFIKLQNAGLEPNRKLMTTLGNAAAVSKDKMGALQAVTNLYSRTVAGGLGVEELDQLNDRGIPVYDILMEKLGKTRGEMSKFGKSAENVALVRQALSEGFDERFGGGMERASQTLTGKFGTLQDTMEGLLIKVGEGGLSDAVKNATSSFTDFIKQNEELALALGEKLGQAVTFVTDGIIMLFENAHKAQPIFDLLGVIFRDIVAPAAVLIFDALVKISEILKPMIEATLPVAKTIFESLAAVMTNVVIPAFNSIVDVVTGVIEKIDYMIDRFGAGITKAKELGTGVKDSVVDGFSKAGNAITGFVEGGLAKMGFMEKEAVGNSIIPDMVNGIGKYMDMMPKKMVDPLEHAVKDSLHTMNKLPTAINPNVISSPVSGVGSGMSGISNSNTSNANSTMNFNISGVNAGNTNQMQSKQMKQYIEGVATQVAYSVLRQNTGFGGLV